MAIEIQMRRIRDRQGRVRLAPADALAEEALSEMKVKGSLVKAKLTATRSCKRSAWFRALVAVVAQTLDDPHWTPEQVKRKLKIRCGLYDEWRDDDGKTYVELKSVAFRKMDETEFAAFCDRAVKVIITEILPGVERDDLVREIEGFLGQRRAA